MGSLISFLASADEKFDQLLKAAERGDPKAQHSVAFSYFLAKNNGQMIKWYRRAISQGNESSLYDLGGFYSSGYGVEKNIIVSYALVSIVARKGIPSLDEVSIRPTTVELARERLDNISRQLTGPQISEAKALAEKMIMPGNLLAALDSYLEKAKHEANEK